MFSPCPIDPVTGLCSRHGVAHVGRLLDLALDPTVKGERYRLLWDRQAGIETPAPSPAPSVEVKAAAPSPAPAPAPVAPRPKRKPCGCGKKIGPL